MQKHTTHFCFRVNNGHANALQCYSTRALPIALEIHFWTLGIRQTLTSQCLTKHEAMKLRGPPIWTNALTTTAQCWVQCFNMAMNWHCAEHGGQDTAVELYSSTCLSISLNWERNVQIQVTAASNELSLTVCKRWRPNRRRREEQNQTHNLHHHVCNTGWAN